MPLFSAEITGEVFEWRGPAPFYFLAVPEDEAAQIKESAKLVTYGWGVVPATICVGGHEFETALFPRNGGYLVPLKDKLRNTVGVDVGDNLTITLTIGPAP